MKRDARETIFELVDRIKTPILAVPDPRNDAQIFASKFENLNRHIELKFTKQVMEGFYELLEDVSTLRKRETGQSLEEEGWSWNTSVDDVEYWDDDREETYVDVDKIDPANKNRFV